MSKPEALDAPFEELLERLEETVDKLEQPDIGLDEALSVYEDGVKILRECLSRLKSAEGRVETLVKESEDLLKKVPFEPAQDLESETEDGGDEDLSGENT